MIGVFHATEPAGIDFSLALKANLKEWKALAESLKKSTSFPAVAVELIDIINDVVEQAEDSFWPRSKEE